MQSICDTDIHFRVVAAEFSQIAMTLLDMSPQVVTIE
jgi:hypothetical protein